MSALANKKRKKRKRGEKKKKKNVDRDSNSGLLTHKAVSLTIRPWEYEATGLTEHKHTYIHVLSYGWPIKMAAIPEVFALLWEKTSELSDGYWAIVLSSSLGTRHV